MIFLVGKLASLDLQDGDTLTGPADGAWEAVAQAHRMRGITKLTQIGQASGGFGLK